MQYKKDELKEIILREAESEFYDNGFIYIIQKHSGADIPVEAAYLNDIQAWREILYKFIHQLMPVFTRKFLIMLDSSQGTKYEDTKDEFISFMKDILQNI